MKQYIIYRLNTFSFFYYGMTTDLNKREHSHATAVMELIREGAVDCLPSETGKLYLHHLMGIRIKLKKKHPKLQDIKNEMRLVAVFETNNKEQAMYIEAFLVKEALQKKKCLNRRSSFDILAGRKHIETTKKAPSIKL